MITANTIDTLAEPKHWLTVLAEREIACPLVLPPMKYKVGQLRRFKHDNSVLQIIGVTLVIDDYVEDHLIQGRWEYLTWDVDLGLDLPMKESEMDINTNEY